MHDNLCCPASNCVFIVLIGAPPNNVCQWQKPRWFSHLWTKVPSFPPIHPFILYSMPYRCYFLSTLFHSLHYIICLIQNSVSFPPKNSILLLKFPQKNCRYPLHLFLWIFAGYFTSYSLFLPFFPFFSSFFLFRFFLSVAHLFPFLSLFSSFYSDFFPPPRHFHEEHKKSIVFVCHAHIPLGWFSDIKEGLHAK